VITLYGFGRIFREGIGETKDLRIERALQDARAWERALDLYAQRLGVPVADIR
jgi:hypothetical protein